MFKFLKRKLKGAIGKVADEVEKTPEEEVKEPIAKIKEEKKKGIVSKIKEKIVTKKISTDKFEKLFFELEVVLLENNVAVEVIEKIKNDLKGKIVDNPIKRGSVLDVIKESLEESVSELFLDSFDFISKVKSKKPYVIAFVGINGSGKTTTIAKVVNLLQKRGLSCVLAAADTFRAAGIHQIQELSNKLGVRLIKHDYGADPTAVSFDAVKHAEAKGMDVVLIDTAGRLHSNKNLMNELKKIDKIIKPNLTVFVGESITGNDIVFQVEKFDEAIGIDAIILTKSDIDEKGGAIISVSYVTKKPILFLGCGQRFEDLKPFNKEEVIKGLGL